MAKADFGELTFNDIADFNNATFNAAANSSSCNFKKKAVFLDTTFGGDA
jgi:hypothetical protein